MITDPQNVFEELQNDIAAKIEATSPFDSINFPDGTPFKVLTEDQGDIQFEFDQMIALLGLAITVKAPTAASGVTLPDLPGPLIDLLCDIWMSEAPTFNRSDSGTQVRASRALEIVFNAMQGFQPTSVNTPVHTVGFENHRERVYDNREDREGRLIMSRILHLKCPLVALQASPT